MNHDHIDYESEAQKTWDNRMKPEKKKEFPIKAPPKTAWKVDDEAVRRGALAPIPGRVYKAYIVHNRNLV